MLILQYKVSLLLTDMVAAFVLFIFMLVFLCFFVMLPFVGKKRFIHTCNTYGWLGSRLVSVLDSGAEGPGYKSQSRRCRVTVLGKLFTPICLCSPSSETGSSPLKGCEVTAGLAESSGSLPPGLWLTSPAGWLPRTGNSSGTLRSGMEYRLPFLQRLYVSPVCHISVTMKRVGFPTPPSPSLTVKRRWISQGGRDQRRDYQIMSHTNKLIAAQTDEARIMRRIMASTGTACCGLILN